MNNTKKQVNNVWDNYWRSGAEASFLNKNTSLQRYQMRKFWFERMSEFEAKSPIVDIGCGNGILIGWLNEYKNEKNKSKWQSKHQLQIQLSKLAGTGDILKSR